MRAGLSIFLGVRTVEIDLALEEDLAHDRHAHNPPAAGESPFLGTVVTATGQPAKKGRGNAFYTSHPIQRPSLARLEAGGPVYDSSKDHYEQLRAGFLERVREPPQQLVVRTLAAPREPHERRARSLRRIEGHGVRVAHVRVLAAQRRHRREQGPRRRRSALRAAARGRSATG